MVDQSLLPHLKADFGKGHQTYSALLHFVGRPESLLMQELASLGLDERLVVTSYVQPDEIQVRVTLHDVAKEEATSLLEQAIAKIARQEADYYIGRGAGVSMASQLVALLKEKGLKITGAESLTGGLFQATLCSVAGASEVFDGGFVTYAASAKEQLLGVPVETVRQYGVVSKQTAEAMASGCQQKMGVDVGLSFTGVAGPDDLEGPPGRHRMARPGDQGTPRRKPPPPLAGANTPVRPPAKRPGGCAWPTTPYGNFPNPCSTFCLSFAKNLIE